MKHNRKRVLKWTMARTPQVRAIRAWRRLLPDWTPTLDQLIELETRPHEHRHATSVLTEGWEPSDARWDVLLALLEWERRDIQAELSERSIADELTRLGQEMTGDNDQIHVREGQLEGEPVRPLPGLLPDDETTENLLPDPEPVQPEQGEGAPEDAPGDRDGGERTGTHLVPLAPRVYLLRDKAAGE